MLLRERQFFASTRAQKELSFHVACEARRFADDRSENWGRKLQKVKKVIFGEAKVAQILFIASLGKIDKSSQ